MCVQLEDYDQVYESVQAYTSGAVRVWIGTSNTMYAFYNVIPKVGLPGPILGQALPHSSPDKSHLKWGHSPSSIQAVGQSTMVQ